MQSQTTQRAFFLVLLTMTTIAFIWVIRGFLEPLFWAAVLTIIFYPLQRWGLKKLGNRPSLVASLSLLAIILTVLVPLFLVGLAVSNESIAFYQRLTAQGGLTELKVMDWARPYLDYLGGYLVRFNVDTQNLTERISQGAMQASQYLASHALSIGQNALRFTISLFLMLYVLFFFLRSGPEIIEKLVQILPLGDARERRLFAKFAEVSRATIKGTLVIAIIQGALGGLLFWITGVSGPIFWAIIMTILSIIPAVGASLVWIPAAAIMLVGGNVWQGVTIIIGGALVIGLIDNILRPILVGRDTKMPDALILISTLGGISLFGVSGFVIGPIIAAFFLVVWEMFQEEFGYPADPEGPPAPPATVPPETVADDAPETMAR